MERKQNVWEVEGGEGGSGLRFEFEIVVVDTCMGTVEEEEGLFLGFDCSCLVVGRKRD